MVEGSEKEKGLPGEQVRAVYKIEPSNVQVLLRCLYVRYMNFEGTN